MGDVLELQTGGTNWAAEGTMLVPTSVCQDICGEPD